MAYRYLDTAEVATIGFRSLGAGVMVHELANIVFPHNISLGDHVRIDGFCNLVATCPIEIGRYVHISSFCHVSAAAPIRFEDFSGISHGCQIFTASDDLSGASLTNPTTPARFKQPFLGPVGLGRHVLVGANSVILPAVAIGEGSVIGALSMVDRDLEPWGIYAGVPARRIKDRARTLLDFERQLGEAS